jgi:hypothetical protein
MKNQIIPVLLTILLTLTGCRPVTSGSPANSLPPGELAAETVQSFFHALHDENYQLAVEMYGGAYTVLENYNPDLDPTKKARLLQRACQANGFVCLPVREVIEVKSATPGTYVVSVSFQTPDGELFVRSDCCGGTEAKNQLETVFTFQVEENQDDQFQVMDLPVYQP